MTFIEFFSLFDHGRRFFVGVVVFVLVLSALLYHFQPLRYTSELLLTVTRTSVTPTPEYGYDHFYQFQANERLAETLNQYIASKTGKRDTAERAHLEGEAYRSYLEAKLRVTRLGTSGIVVEYAAPNVAFGEKLGEAIVLSANAYLVSLNEDARQSAWFTLISDKPVTTLATFSLGRMLGLGLVSGLFLAFWGVVGRHFWSEYRQHRPEHLAR